jgi:cellulose synthase/poly-beta-1,6-N-acetylglucosamine synthase-like glycosyltransferase
MHFYQIAILAAVVVLAYTYFGYPLVLGALVRFRAAREREVFVQPEVPPMVSVLLCVHNGAAFLRRKVDSLLAQHYPPDRIEILIYSDGSTDDTAAVAHELARSAAARGRIRVVVQHERRGKPTGLNVLRNLAQGELLLLNDVRQPLAPTAIRALAAGLENPAYGCATGNLVVEGQNGSATYWRYENWIRCQESQFRGLVGMTGPIAMVRRADFTPLPDDVILDDVWIPMSLTLRGKRVRFVAEAKAYDTAFDDEREFRRKIRTLAGNYQLFARMPALLAPTRNPIWFETISHKILRLAAPWLLLVLAAASVGAALTASTTNIDFLHVLLFGQLAFYAPAALGRRAGRIGGVTRTFVVLNFAALVGLWGFLTGRQRVTWQVTR